MPRLFTGKMDGLNYFENDVKTHRAVYTVNIMSGLELPGGTPEIKIVRSFKWSGTDWRPAVMLDSCLSRWCNEITKLIGAES